MQSEWDWTTHDLCEMPACAFVLPAQFALYAVLVPAFGCGPFRVVEDDLDDSGGGLSAGRDHLGRRTRRRQRTHVRLRARARCLRCRFVLVLGGRDQRASDDDGGGRDILRGKEAGGVLCRTRSAVRLVRRCRLGRGTLLRTSTAGAAAMATAAADRIVSGRERGQLP